MKFMHITFHFEYSDQVEKILDKHEIENFVRYPMREGKDRDGKHYGTQVYPGSTTVIQAQVPEDRLDAVMEDLKAFREGKNSRRHVEALVIHIERRLE